MSLTSNLIGRLAMALSVLVPSYVTAACTPITTLPFIASTPGEYCFTGDLIYTPGGAGTAAITVTANNVSIDLAGWHLSQGNVQAASDGIRVDSGLSNVSISNGTVISFTGNAIRYQDSTDIITIENIIALQNGVGLFLGPDSAATDPSEIGTYVSNVRINNSVLDENGLGLQIFGNKNIYIDTVHCDNSQSGFGAIIQGIAKNSLTEPIDMQIAGYLHNLDIYNSTFNSTQGFGDGFNAAGCFIFSAKNLHIDFCSFNDNALAGFASAGLNAGGLVNTIIENSQANNNVYAGPAPGFALCGFLVQSNVFFPQPLGLETQGVFTMRNCEANGNIQQGGIVAGFDIAYEESTFFDNCRASRNISIAQPPNEQVEITVLPYAVGFNLENNTGGSIPTDAEGDVSQTLFRNCVATENSCVPLLGENGDVITPAQGFAAGFSWYSGSFLSPDIERKNVSFVGCEAYGNTGGVDSPPINIEFFNITVPSGVFGIGAGIYVDRGVLPGVAQRVLDPTNPLNIPLAYKNITVENCRLNGNRGQGDSGKQYSAGLTLLGIDTATVLNNIAMGNTNGFVFSGGRSFSGKKIAPSAHIIARNNEAISNECAGFKDTQRDCKRRNAFIGNSALHNCKNFDLTKESYVRENYSIEPCKKPRRS